MKKLPLLLLPIVFILMGCPGKKLSKPVYLRSTVDVDKLTAIDNKFDRFKQQILGHFSNKEQVKNNPGLGEREQEFIIVPAMEDRPGEFWVYLEFFSPNLVEQPINHRVEQYVRVDRDTFRMEVYLLNEPEKYVNAWKKAKPLEGLNIKEDLTRVNNCDLFIVADEKPHTFQTLAPEDINCELGSQGATKYVNLYFGLSDIGYDMRFQFYDANKEILRETETGLIFKKLDYKAEGYRDYMQKEKN